MDVTILKFGGSSLDGIEALRRCAAVAAGVRQDGHPLVVVVSAMGRTTDQLIGLASSVSQHPNAPALDLLLATGEQVSTALMVMALQERGVDAVALAGAQLGITTCLTHGRARIESMDVSRARRELAGGRVVVVPGFQGLTPDGRTTTLGRGGSDITAVALAAAFGVKPGRGACEICTDVEGVFTADPGVVPDARCLPRIGYRPMLEMARQGAGVLHSRAVERAQGSGVPIHVRHSQRDQPGTMILRDDRAGRVGGAVAGAVGCAMSGRLVLVRVPGIPGGRAVESALAARLRDDSVDLRDLELARTRDEVCLRATLAPAELDAFRALLGSVLPRAALATLRVVEDLAAVSLISTRSPRAGATVGRMVEALAGADIRYLDTVARRTCASCLVPHARARDALRAVHAAFNLARVEPAAAVATPA